MTFRIIQVSLSDQLRRRTLLAGRIARANVSRPVRPLKLNLALTYWCQYRCRTCNIWQRRPTDELTRGEIDELIARNPHVSWLDLTGGEIFLRDDIDEIFETIIERWRDLVILHFPTNGFQTDKIVKIARRLPGRGVPHVIVTVSVDGDEALNDEIRGIKGGFRRQMDTLRELRRIEGLRAVAGMTLSQFNVGQVDRTFEAVRTACPGLTLGDFHLNFAQLSGHYYANADESAVVAPRHVAMRELRLYRSQRPPTRSLDGWIEDRFLGELDAYLDSGKTPMRCHALRSSCFIDPWGTVYPCISYSRPLGNLRDTGMSLAPIWDRAAPTQREIWNGDCPQCWTACEAYQSILGNLARVQP